MERKNVTSSIDDSDELLTLFANQNKIDSDAPSMQYDPQTNRYRFIAATKSKSKIMQYKGKKYVPLKPIIVPVSLANQNAREMGALVRSMLQDIVSAVLKVYRENNTIISYVADSDPKNLAKYIEVVIGDKIGFWRPIFNKFSLTFGKNLVKSVNKHVDYNIAEVENVLEEWHIPFSDENKRALIVQQSVIRDNVSLIRNMLPRQREVIFDKVMEAMTRGRDEKWLKEQLNNVVGIETRRSERIARDQTNKAMSAISTAKQLDCGITKNIWRHSHGDRVPRQSHLRADGRVFDLEQGCLIDGEYIYPAEKINCTCYSIPAFELE